MSPVGVERIVADAVAALNRSDWDTALKDASADLVFDTHEFWGSGGASTKGLRT